jgi:hypothetical protein
MDYEARFRDAVAAIRAEGRYRVFADLARQCGRFPWAHHHVGDEVREVVVWCSNDYLGMGQHEVTRNAAIEAVLRNFTGLVVVDEAYVDFADENCLGLVREYVNLIISRTLSKAYSLAGVPTPA